MKLENLNGKKFEVLSDEAMMFIVGGQNVRTDKGVDNKGVAYSNDYSSTSGSVTTVHISDTPAGDWSGTYLNRACGPEFIVPADPGDPDWAEYQTLYTFTIE